MRNGQGEGQTALLPRRERTIIGLPLLRQAQPLEQIVAGRHIMVGAEEVHRLPDLHGRRQSRGLQLDTDDLAEPLPVPARIEAHDLHPATIRPPDALEALQCAGLPGAVRPQKSEDLAWLHRKADAVHGDLTAV